jgi:DNA-binding LytR/AlgR family response regulator
VNLLLVILHFSKSQAILIQIFTKQLTHFKNKQNTLNSMNADRFSNLIIIVENNKKHPVDLNVVLKIKAADDRCNIYFINDRVLSVQQPLDYFEDLLKNHAYFRINRSCLINLNFLQNIANGSRNKVILSDNSFEIISQMKAQKLKTLLNL